MQELIFYILSASLIISALLVITVKNPVHAVLLLIFTFCNAASLFILLGAEYIAFTLIIVYVGAVAVLFLFVVMMLDINFVRLKQGLLRNLPVAAALGIITALLLLTAINSSSTFIPIKTDEEAILSPTSQIDAKAHPKQLSNTGSELSIREARSDVYNEVHERSSDKVGAISESSITNTQAIGLELYTKYFIIFQLAGILLLIAMIGAIVLTMRPNKKVRRQDIMQQIGREKSKTLEIVKVGFRQGVKIP